jgi:sulfate permease, SulP family
MIQPQPKPLQRVRLDGRVVVLDFHEARVCDLSGLEAIKSLAARYKKLGKRLKVRHLSPDCRRMLDRAGDLISVEVAEDDPIYLVARIPGQPGVPG